MKKYHGPICLSLSLIIILAANFQTPRAQEPTQTPKDTSAKKPNAPPASDDVVRINTNLVQIDVTVSDGKGRPVTGLKPEDFEIYEEGRLQRITNFSYVTASPASETPKASTPPLVVSGRNEKARTVSVPAPVPPVILRPEQVRRTIALVVDDLGLSHESSARVRQALKKFVDEQMQPGDLAAVIRTGAGMGALQQFTTDKQLLHAAIDRIHYNLASRGDISTFAPIGGNGIGVQINDDSLALTYGGGQNQTRDERGGASFLRAPGEKLDQFREELFSVGTLGALNFVVRGLKDLPGRKSVVLFSDGFKLYTEDPGNARIRDNLERLTDLANRASVVFYTIDPRGLQYLGITAADNLNAPLATMNAVNEKPVNVSNMTPEQIARLGGLDAALAYAKARELKPEDQFYKDVGNVEQAITDRRSNFFESQQGLSYLATQTGGFLVKNNNDINGAIRRVLNDQTGFYLLAYRPDDANGGGRRGFRTILVKTKLAGLHVRTRKGFYGFSEEEARRPIRRTADEQLFAALTSPFKSGEIKLRMTAQFGYDQVRGPFTQSLVYIDAHDLTYQEKPDGSRQAVIDIMAFTFGDNGKVIDHNDRAYSIQVGAKEFQRALKEGLVYIVTLPAKKPGAYQLRIAVRDHATEKVGSANQFIDIPDVKKGRLALSGMTIRGVRPAASMNSGAEPASSILKSNAVDELNDPLTGPAGRHLQSGMVMNYAYFVYNAQLDKTTRLPVLSTQLRLFREGAMIFAGQLNEYKGAPQKDSKQLVGGGSFKLGSDLPPGEYVLQVIVIDHLAKSGHQVATQWIDFDIEER